MRRIAARALRQGAHGHRYRWSQADQVGRCEHCQRMPLPAPLSAELFVGRRQEQERDIHGHIVRESWHRSPVLCLGHAVRLDFARRAL